MSRSTAPAPTTASYEPYRYAGEMWWRWTEDDPKGPGAKPPGQRGFPLGGGNPGNPSFHKGTDRERGFEDYHSVRLIRQHQRDDEMRSSAWSSPELSLSSTRSWTVKIEPAKSPGLEELANVFNCWAQDMTAWAKAAREDILQMEKAIEDLGGKVHKGDTGDPPPVPWK